MYAVLGVSSFPFVCDVVEPFLQHSRPSYSEAVRYAQPFKIKEIELSPQKLVKDDKDIDYY